LGCTGLLTEKQVLADLHMEPDILFGPQMTTITLPAIVPKNRFFPSRIALLAAGELVFIALLLRLSNSPAFFAAAIACSLGAIQLGIILINRFEANTRQIRKIARNAEFSSQAILITDPQGRIKWTNMQFTRLTGFYLSEIAGKTCAMVLHGQDTKARAVETIRRHMRLAEPFEVEILEYNRDGESLLVYSRGEPVFNTYGQLTHYVIKQSCSEMSDCHIEEMASIRPFHRSTHFLETSSNQVSIDKPDSTGETTGGVAELTRQLESLSVSDDRQLLQYMVEGLKTKVDQCVASLPPAASDQTKHKSANQQNEG